MWQSRNAGCGVKARNVPSRACRDLRLEDGPVEPDEVVPAQDALTAVEQLRVAATGRLERKRLHAIGRVGGRVAKNVEHLLLPRDLGDAGVPGRVELHVGRIAFVAHAMLVLPIEELFTTSR